MTQNYQIEPKTITNPLTNDPFGTANNVDIVIQYSVGDPTAKGYFTLKDYTNNPITYGNGVFDLDTTDWGDDDSIMIDRLCTALGVTIIQ